MSIRGCFQMAIWFPNFRNIIPEVVTALLMISIGIQTLELPQKCLLFAVNAVMFRLLWNSSILIHGFGHVVCTAIVARSPAFMKISNLFEHRNLSDTFKSLLPINPVFIPLLNNGCHPWVATGNATPWAIRFQALDGILFNIIALGVVPLV